MAIEDLKPVQTKDEAKERGRNGGIASGIARRNKKTLRDALEILLGRTYGKDDNGKVMDGKDIIAVKMFEQAAEGSIKAAEFIRDTIGEKPSEKLALSNNEDEIDGITLSFVDKSKPSTMPEKDPKIIGDYTEPIETEE